MKTMLDNLYTTKMSAEKKSLQKRFLKIRSKSGKFSKLMAFTVSVVIALTILLGIAVMAMVDDVYNDVRKITFSANGEMIEFKNKPFIENNIVYLPLREIFEKVGVMQYENSRIEWNDGEINITVPRNFSSECTYYTVTIGKAYLKVSNNGPVKDQPIKTALGMDAPPILKDTVTYVSYNYIRYMLVNGMGGSIYKSGNEISCIVTGGNNDSFDFWKNIRGINYQDDYGVTVSAKNVTPTGITFTVNSSEHTPKITLDGEFVLEKYTDNKWSQLLKTEAYDEMITEMTVNEFGDGYGIYAGWKYECGALSPGIYRIGKNLKLHRTVDDYDIKTYYAEFVITDFRAYISPDLRWPCDSDVISHAFEAGKHNGIDIAAPEGTDVIASANGTVSETGFDSKKGNYIIITGKNNIDIFYGQLSLINVKEGDEVICGDLIGKVGNTGMSTGAHLHFEVMINGEYYNPELLY